MITAEQGYTTLSEIIEFDLRPPHYEEAVKMSETARTFLSKEAKGQRKKLNNIRKSEDKEQQDQRERLSNAITSAAISPIFSYVEEVWRTDGITKSVMADSDTTKEIVDDHFRRYFYDDSLHKYCFNAALHYAAKTDPNAWTVFEAMFDNGPQGQRTIIDMYPVEVASSEVRSFKHDETGTLQHLAFEFMRTTYQATNRKNTRELSDFYLYGAGFSVHFAEFFPGYVDAEPFDYEANGYVLQEVGRRQFYTRIFTNGTTEVPAIRWAAWWADKYRHNQVGEVIFAPAFPTLDELLKDNSLLQLQKYIHIFAEKHQYVRRCQNRNEEGMDCINGYYGGTFDPDNMCSVCKGTGKVMAASEQDVITLAWPERAEELVDLAKITHYVERPLGIVEFYRQEVDKAKMEVMYATFNQQNVDQGEVLRPETATKTRLDYDKIYNKISSFAELVARAWEKAQRTAFQYYGQSDVTADMTYPHDFKMKSIAELLVEYKAGKEAGVPYHVLESLEMDMTHKKYRNDPLRAADIAAFTRWKPWKDKTVEEIVIITQGRANTDLMRVMWENWDAIVEAVMLDLGDTHFSELPPEEQQRELRLKAEEIIEDIQYKQMPEPMALPPMDDIIEEEEEEITDNEPI